jgi:hypothetical protein
MPAPPSVRQLVSPRVPADRLSIIALALLRASKRSCGPAILMAIDAHAASPAAEPHAAGAALHVREVLDAPTGSYYNRKA